MSLLSGKKLRIVGKQECVNFNLFPGGPGHLGVGGKTEGMDRRWNRILSTHKIPTLSKRGWGVGGLWIVEGGLECL